MNLYIERGGMLQNKTLNKMCKRCLCVKIIDYIHKYGGLIE
jgi:hypothetical protein